LSEHERYNLLREKTAGIENALNAEIARRKEAERNLQSHIDMEFSKFNEKLASQGTELRGMIRSVSDQLNRAVTDLNAVLGEETAQRKADVDHVGMSVCARVEEVAHSVGEERLARLEQERQSLKRCGDCNVERLKPTHPFQQSRSSLVHLLYPASAWTRSSASTYAWAQVLLLHSRWLLLMIVAFLTQIAASFLRASEHFLDVSAVHMNHEHMRYSFAVL
jgi:hypothetical protein